MVCRGYTRKEPFANGIWTPKAENWNGRVAMLGFTGIVLTEALAGKSVLQVRTILPLLLVNRYLCKATCVLDVKLHATVACNLYSTCVMLQLALWLCSFMD